MYDTYLEGNNLIEKAINRFHSEESSENLYAILDIIRDRMHDEGHFIFPVTSDKENKSNFAFRTIETTDGLIWDVAFTSQEEYEKGAPSQTLSYMIDSALHCCEDGPSNGFIINPWGENFFLTRQMIERVFETDRI